MAEPEAGGDGTHIYWRNPHGVGTEGVRQARLEFGKKERRRAWSPTIAWFLDYYYG